MRDGSAIRVLSRLFVALLGMTTAGALAALFLYPKYGAVVPLVAGALVLRSAFHDRHRSLRILEAPTAKASAAAVGLAELAGTVACADPTIAPFSGRPSAHWFVDIEQDEGERGQHERWNRIAGRHGPIMPFRLHDESGSIPVWMVGSELVLEPEHWQSDRTDVLDLPHAARALLEEMDVAWPKRSDTERVCVTEHRIEIGRKLYVLGTITERGRLPDGTWHFAGHVMEKMPSGTPAEQLQQSAQWLEQSTRIHGQQWVRRNADRMPVWSDAPAADPQDAVVWWANGERPFLISDRSEGLVLAKIATRYQWKLAIGAILILGASLALAVAWGAQGRP